MVPEEEVPLFKESKPLVIILITPPTASGPYIEAPAPLRISILSISILETGT